MHLKSAWNYELLVKKTYEDLLQDDAIEVYHRKRYVGKRTAQPYEIDLSFSFKKGGADFLVLIECKYYATKVRVNDVMEFAYKIGDIGAQKGILFSTVGFQRGALRVAKSSSIALVRLSQPEVIDFVISSRGDSIYLDLAFGDRGTYERLDRPPIAYLTSTFDNEADFHILDDCVYDAIGKVRRGSFMKFVREVASKRSKSSVPVRTGAIDQIHKRFSPGKLTSTRPASDGWKVDLQTADDLEGSARGWVELKRYNAAAKLLEDAVAIRRELSEPNDLRIAKTLHSLAMIYLEDQRIEDARKALESALSLFNGDETLEEDSVLPSILIHLAGFHSNVHEYSTAESMLKRCVALCEGKGRWDRLCAIALNNLGCVYRDTHSFDNAEKYLLRAIPLFEMVFGKDDLRTAKPLDNYATLLRMSGHLVHAKELESRAQSIRAKCART